jgi:hypothetical protein
VLYFFAKLGIFPFFSSSLYSCANSAYFSSGSGSQNSGSGKEILRKFLFYLMYVLRCLFKQCFVESKIAWQRGIFAQNTSGLADFCIKSDSNALAGFSKPRIGSEQVIKRQFFSMSRICNEKCSKPKIFLAFLSK